MSFDIYVCPSCGVPHGDLSATVSILESRNGELEAQLAEKDARIAEMETQLADKDAKIEELEADRERLAFLAWPEPFFDEYAGVDLHRQASIYASAFGRDEPNRNDYIAAFRDAINEARAAKKL